MDKDKCPFCGAYKIDAVGFSWIGFSCGTWIDPIWDIDNPDMSKRSVACYKEQIADLTKRLEAWRKSWWILDAFVHSDEDKTAHKIHQKLRELGEIE